MNDSFRSLTRRLFTDSQFRSAFVKSPEEAIGDAPLAAEERRALLRLRTRLAASEGADQRLSAAGPLSWWP